MSLAFPYVAIKVVSYILCFLFRLTNCLSFVLSYLQPFQPSRVTAHTVPIEGYPLRTTILIKLDKEVLEREEQLK